MISSSSFKFIEHLIYRQAPSLEIPIGNFFNGSVLLCRCSLFPPFSAPQSVLFHESFVYNQG